MTSLPPPESDPKIDHGASPREFHMLSIEQVDPNPKQPRRTFDRTKLQELARSIRGHGVIQPILVRRIGNRFQVISGERRFQACQIAGLTHIPAMVKDIDDQEAMFAGLIENIQREDLNPVEEAQAIREILQKYGFTHEQLSDKLGRSRPALTNLLRILQLPADIQKLIVEGTLSAGHAKVLAGIHDPKDVRIMVKRVLREQLSVYETEKQVADFRGSAGSSTNLHVARAEATLQEVLGAKVRIHQGRLKGRIEIEFYDKEDLERVVESLIGNRF